MKIFGIGLSRTGTSSLHLALLTMGIPAIHYPRKMAQYWMRGIFNRKVQADCEEDEAVHGVGKAGGGDDAE